MKELAAAVVLLLVSGCLAQLTDGVANDGNAMEEPRMAQPHVDTSSLYLERDATGVFNTDTEFPGQADIGFDFSNTTTSDGLLIVYYFHSSGCTACRALRPEIDRLEAEYAAVVWLEYDLANASGSEAYRDFAIRYNLSDKQMLVPQVLVNGTILTDRFNINKSLEGIIKAYENTSAGMQE